MNLPKHIHKTDGAIARSFSRELGLSLDFKTGRTTAWPGPVIEAKEGVVLMDNGKRLVVLDRRFVSIFDFDSGRLLKTHSVYYTNNCAITNGYKIDENTLLIGAFYGGLFFFDVEKGITSWWKIDSEKKYRYYSVGFAPKHQWLAVEKVGETIDIIDISSKTIKTTLDISKFKKSSVRQIAFLENDQSLMVHIDKRFLFYNTSTFSLEHEFDTETLGEYMSISFFDKEDHTLILSNNLGKLFFCDLTTEKLKRIHDFKIEKNNCRIYNWESKIVVENVSGLVNNKNSDIKIVDKNSLKTIAQKSIPKKFYPWHKTPNYFIGIEENSQIVFFDKELNISKTIELNKGVGTLLRYHKKNKLFIFNNALFNIKNSDLYNVPHNGRYDIYDELSDIEGSEYQVYIIKSPITKNRDLLFLNLNNKKHHTFNFPYPTKSISSISVKYIQKNSSFLITAGKNFIIYNADEQMIILHYDIEELPKIKHGYFPAGPILSTILIDETIIDYSSHYGELLSFNLENKQVERLNFAYKYNVEDTYQGINYAYKILPCPQSSTFYLIESFSIEGISDRKTKIQEFDKNLNVIKKKNFEMGQINISGFGFKDYFACDKSGKFIIAVGKVTHTDGSNKKQSNVLKINTNDFSVETICYFNPEGYAEKFHVKISDCGNYVAIAEERKALHLLNLRTKKVIGKIKSLNSFEWELWGFDTEAGLFMLERENDMVSFYHTEPFTYLGDMYLNNKGAFYIGLNPDQTSPNGWFYTNAPEKVNVLKTKADGTEPELLPLDNEERQVFIKHHNRKDIVLKKLFEPEKYAEFARLNAGAEEIARKDMAIELSKEEAKKLAEK